jgi:predicted AlkP superfamily phosphohydrolase/phosphomutase
VFLNVRGREPEGSVAPEAARALCDQLQHELSHVRGPLGEIWHNQIERPDQLYRAARGDAPDLLAFFDQLSVRALASVGASSLYSARDPRGGDAANHDPYGIFVLSGAGVTACGQLDDCSIHDVGASVLGLFGAPLPDGWLGSDRTRPA